MTTPQSEFFGAKERYVAAVAGFGSGKTQGAVSRMIATKFAYPNVDLAYLAPSYGLIRDIFYPYITDFLNEMKIKHTIKRDANNIYIQGAGKIFCRTMNNPDMIVGWQAGDAFLDEFDILSIEKANRVLNKLSARLRQRFPDGKKNQRFISTTPEGFKATYKYFKKDPLPDSRLIQMSTYSNPHLPDDYIQGLIDLYPEQLVKAYLNGEFVNLVSGAVYPYFDRETHNTFRTVKKGEPLDIGIDFNVGKMSAVVYAPVEIRNGLPLLQIIDELIGYADTPALIEAIEENFDGHKINVFPDAAGKNRNTTGATITDHKLLKAAGFRLKALNANPFVKDRVQSVNKLFSTGQLLINVEAAPQTTEAIEQQVYDKNGKPDKTMDVDHPLDALGYRVCKDFLLSRPKVDYRAVL